MKNSTIVSTIAGSLALVATAAAQAPPPAAPAPRSVTLTLAEYNRLLDLSTRTAPGPAAPPAAAVLAAANLHIRAERDVVRGTFNLSGDEADVHLSSGLVTARSAAGGRTLVDATLIPGSTTEVWWLMRDSAPVAAARETRALADVLTLMTIAEADIRMVALIDVSVLQGEPRTFD